MSLEANQRRGYQVLTDLSNREGLSVTGANWLAKVFDPYHDSALMQTGIPDTFDAKSVTREYRQSIDVSRASLGLPAGDPGNPATWDVQFNLFPFFTKTRTELEKGLVNLPGPNFGRNYVSNAPGGGANEVTLYPLHISAKNATSPLPLWPVPHPANEWKGASDLPNGYYHGGIDIPTSVYESQRCRIVAAGFEVVNTTALQYMNGTCTVYRPRAEFDLEDQVIRYVRYHLVEGGLGPVPDYVRYMDTRLPTRIIQLPFSTTQEAMRCDNVRQWSAVEGAYCVGVLDTDEMCRFTSPFDMTPLVGLTNFRTAETFSCLTSKLDRVLPFHKDKLANDVPWTPVYTQPLYVNALETSCALFTGLDPNTTFTVNVKWLVESIPDQFQEDNYLAVPSTPFDPVALEYYRRVVRDIPAGVMVKDNPLGEWFSQIMGILADHAVGVGTGIGTLFGAPSIGAAIGGGVGAAARALGNYNQNLLNETSRGRIRTKF